MEVKEIIKETISKWNTAVAFHNSGKYKQALETYYGIEHESARMCYNQACAHIKLGNMDGAIESLTRAIEKDKHLAIAYFLRGTLCLQHNCKKQGTADLEMTRALLRGNTYIDYKPLGLYTRLNSYQVLHNLALAYVNAKRLTDARQVLTEALHDADELQRKNLQMSIERIDDGRTDIIPPMEVSLDKVFTPPKSVTQNLEKKGIVRKAKVVSASNEDDRSATFDGSKRVRELKKNPTTPESSINPFKRFIKNKPQRNLSVTDVNGMALPKVMKSSKSMSDLRADDITSSTGSKNPAVRLKRLFQKRNSGDSQTSPEIKLNRSFGDLIRQLSPTLGSNEKSSPRSPFTGVRKLLNNKQKSRTSVPSFDEEMPVIRMRGSASTGDMSKIEKSISRSDSEGYLPMSPKDMPKSTSYEKLHFYSNQQRNSLGSVFGDYLTVIGGTLSMSCDILTAVVTPVEHENNVFNVESQNERSKSTDVDQRYVNETDKPVQFYINSITGDDDAKKEVKSSVNDKTSEDKPRSTYKNVRPPPPSYPPPPLPPNIVINV